MSHIPFTKMHGLGNDFVIIDDRKDEHVLPFNRIPFLAHRKTGIGFDQFIVLKRSTRADVFMQILNADNSEVDACGNATRCVAWMIAEQKQVPHVTIETNAGILSADITGNQRVRVNMGKPSFEWNTIPLAKNVNTDAVPVDVEGLALPVAVNVGNPHVVFFTDGSAHTPLAEFGPQVEQHELFPERVNVSLATVVDDNNINLHVWERGAGLTEACGTAACATLVAAVKKELVKPSTSANGEEGDNIYNIDSSLNGDSLAWANIHLPGGRLRIEWDKEQSGSVFMTGDVATSFYGAF